QAGGTDEWQADALLHHAPSALLSLRPAPPAGGDAPSRALPRQPGLRRHARPVAPPCADGSHLSSQVPPGVAALPPGVPAGDPRPLRPPRGGADPRLAGAAPGAARARSLSPPLHR